MTRRVTKRADSASRFVAIFAIVALLGACSDAAIGIVESGPVGRVDVDVDGPLSGLGAWRYYDGVRLLECDLALEARAVSGSSGGSARWVDGVIDIYDLRTGRYLASDYYYSGDLAWLWGEAEIEAGERQFSRPIRYSSYGPFRVYLLFRYDADGTTRRTEHRFDCR